jgi:hypothetical protein
MTLGINSAEQGIQIAQIAENREFAWITDEGAFRAPIPSKCDLL